MGRSKKKDWQRAIMERQATPYLECPLSYGEVSKILHDQDPANTCCAQNDGMEDEYDAIARAAVGKSGGEHSKIAQAVVNEIYSSFGFTDDDESIKKFVFDVFGSNQIEDTLRQRTKKINSLHIHLFPEDYDFAYDSSSDAKDRRRGVDPMSSEYREGWQVKRRELGLREELYCRDTTDFVENLYLRLSWHEVDTLLSAKEINWEFIKKAVRS